MWSLGPLGFVHPALLAALIALPVLWFVLRAIPPAPIRRRFPGVALLLGLDDSRNQADRTPWWLLLLRMVALGLVIVAFAGPVLYPAARGAGSGPLLIVADGSWASARDWSARQGRMDQLLASAARAGRPVAVVLLSDPPAGSGPAFRAARSWREALRGVRPRAWAPDAEAVRAWASRLGGRFDTLWLSDGLAAPWRADLLAALRGHGQVRVFQPRDPVVALGPPAFSAGAITLAVQRAPARGALTLTLRAHGPDPNGIARVLAETPVRFAPGARSATVTLRLPTELRNRVQRFDIAGIASAGAVSLADDTLRRRKVALVAGATSGERLRLLSPLHFLREALSPDSDVIEGPFAELLRAAPDVVILADVGHLPAEQAAALEAWVRKGGTLVRFAGPKLAETRFDRSANDPLMPVRLRFGGRALGGAMSWSAPKHLQPFDKNSPFYGLAIPPDVTVREQVLAQPDPGLAERTIARLADGTPLVTRKTLGRGRVVLFHVTANAEWSTLPLSGLFVRMLERLAVATPAVRPKPAALEGTTWTPVALLDAFGAQTGAGEQAGIAGAALAAGPVGPAQPPGLYQSGKRRLALNVMDAKSTIAPARWPADLPVEGIGVTRERALGAPLLALAFVLLLADLIAALVLGGRMPPMPGSGGGAAGGGASGGGASGSRWRGLSAVRREGAAGQRRPEKGGTAQRRPAQGSTAQGSTAERGVAPRAAVPGARRALAILALGLLLGAATGAGRAGAQNSGAGGGDTFALRATHGVVLAHVVTGDARVDRIAQAGLQGLSNELALRTSVEPDTPMAVNLETDDLSLFPFLYWPITAGEPLPSARAYAKLNDFLRTGGMILFDTRDGDIAGSGGATTPQARKLQQIAAGLDIPPLAIVPKDHVLTRSFYLISDFPGRYDNPDVWVEAPPPGAARAEGMPFRNLNDNVSPVVIGGNDWAAAWAVAQSGAAMFPVGRGTTGERQREIAYRFGINLIMYDLTGNYKSDQVHVPALLQRLGQ